MTPFTPVWVCPVLQVYVLKYLPENLVGFSYRIWLPPQSSPRVSLILCWLWSLELLLCFLGIIVTVDFYQCQFIVESHHHHEVILRTKLQTLKTCIGQARGELGLLTSPTPERVSLRNSSASVMPISSRKTLRHSRKSVSPLTGYSSYSQGIT